MSTDTPTSRTRGRPRDADLPERRRREIIDVATRHFASKGFHETDLQILADDLGVGKGTVYRYFPSKDELFLATVDFGMQQLKRAVDETASAASTPTERIELAIRGYLQYFDQHPELIELVILERSHFRDRAKPTYFVHLDANIGPWKELLTGMIRDGIIRPMPVERVTEVMSDLLYGTIFTNHFAGRQKSLTSQCEDVLDILFNGLLIDRKRGAGG